MTTARLVVIGASLGGLDALGVVLGGLPEAFGAAVAIVQHRRPEPQSRLAHLLDRGAPLSVTEPDHNDAIEPGRVYLAPPDYHLMVDGERFVLSGEGAVSWARPSIDVLFETAATTYGRRAAGVLLTGASEDGAAGLVAVDAIGGLTIVQDPDTAESPVAPRAALARFRPRYVLPLPEIAPVLVRWTGGLEAP